MAGNLFDNPTLSIMYQDALQSLYNGGIMPWERDLLAEAPLPADMVDPFASEDVKPLSVMNLTYVSLSGWIADAKKEKYYSERFVQLSKLVMKGVSTMARGLVTLHIRGEELSGAPMQIDDLISVGSYHFRKSYLGVVQFSAKHPEIGERLLVNQLGWATTLMRLYKTKEKLAKPVEILNKKSEIRNKISGSADGDRPETEGLPEGNSADSSCLPLPSSLDDESGVEALEPFGSADDGLDPLPALSAPGGYGAVQAFKPLKGSENKKSETLGNKKSEIRNKKSGTADEDRPETEGSPEESCEKSELQTPDTENKKPETLGNKKSEIRNKKSGTADKDRPETAGSSEGSSEKSEFQTLHSELAEDSKTSTPNSESSEDSEIRTAHSKLNKDSEFRDPHSELSGNSEIRTPNSELSDHPPDYYQILYEVFRRSSGNEDGSLDITFDEIHQLLADPEFCSCERQLAEDFRKALESMPDPPEN